MPRPVVYARLPSLEDLRPGYTRVSQNSDQDENGLHKARGLGVRKFAMCQCGTRASWGGLSPCSLHLASGKDAIPEAIHWLKLHKVVEARSPELLRL